MVGRPPGPSARPLRLALKPAGTARGSSLRSWRMVIEAGRAGRRPPGTDRAVPPRPSGPGRAGVLRETALVTVTALLVAVATTWPLAANLSTMAADVADAPFQAWTIDHVQWAVTGGGPLWDAPIFAPNRNTLAYSDSLLGIALPLLPLRWLGLGPLAQLNVALLLGIATSAGGGYLFGRVVSGRRVVGALTAAAFAFGSFGTASTAQVHATVHVGVAVAATAVWWLADRSARGASLTGPVAALVLAVVWQASVSFYPGAYALIVVGLVAAVRWRDLGRRGWTGLGIALVACGLGCGLLLLPYLEVLGEGRDFVRAADEVANLGIDLTRVDPQLTVWGDVLGKDGFSLAAFPGVTLIALSLAGAVHGLRSEDRRVRRTVQTGLVLLGVGLFLAIGTAGEGWRAWSPYRLLFEYVPGFKVIRAAARAWVIGLLGVGLLAGAGCAAVSARLSRARALHVAVAVIAVAGVVAEGVTSWHDRPRIVVSPVDEALAEEPAEGGVVYLPLFVPGPLALATTFGQLENVYGTTAHHRRTPNGYSGLAPREWPEISRRMRSLPSPATLDELRSIGVRFVVVRAEAAGTPWERLLDPAAAAPLVLVGRHGDDLLYEVPEQG